MEDGLAEDLRSLVEVAAVGLVSLSLAAGVVLLSVRVIREIEAGGKADRRTVWRLASLRILTTVLALSGSLVVVEGCLLAIMGLSDFPPTWLLRGRFRQWHRVLFVVSLLTFMASLCTLMPVLESKELTAAWRSFPILKRFNIRARHARITLGRWRPVAALRTFVRRNDRRLW